VIEATVEAGLFVAAVYTAVVLIVAGMFVSIMVSPMVLAEWVSGRSRSG
jgi:hypothetical protein